MLLKGWDEKVLSNEAQANGTFEARALGWLDILYTNCTHVIQEYFRPKLQQNKLARNRVILVSVIFNFATLNLSSSSHRARSSYIFDSDKYI